MLYIKLYQLPVQPCDWLKFENINPDMISNRMLLDVSVLHKKYTKLILIRLNQYWDFMN